MGRSAIVRACCYVCWCAAEPMCCCVSGNRAVVALMTVSSQIFNKLSFSGLSLRVGQQAYKLLCTHRWQPGVVHLEQHAFERGGRQMGCLSTGRSPRVPAEPEMSFLHACSCLLADLVFFSTRFLAA
ncbi:hypothetical protein DUNSADRAFT_4896 [Dunaliella salina]|uniref:Secreted protein n=1 Tax=Dunaliella salina TaxID=3046 RepID=A0ABQ7GR25_DUNSA|nr:hypothetical protein DUNSADRAFT_4896 [Dunaliella salina]KAF5837064.1 hypothetical protein DUNSADRAFT_4896 [Dunaliella salina]|eukprot:KAF5837063.1 hypothetical protein DUNSADRAFT_4896 [Dunaliella salina]